MQMTIVTKDGKVVAKTVSYVRFEESRMVVVEMPGSPPSKYRYEDLQYWEIKDANDSTT